MRILYVTATFPPKSFGGVTTVSYKIARMMSRRGHEVTVFTTDLKSRTTRIPQPSESVDLSGLSVHYFANASNRLANNGFFLPLALIREIRRRIREFELVHLHDFRSLPSVAVHRHAIRDKVPYVLQAHGSVITFFQKGLLKSAYDRVWGLSLLRDADRLIAITPAEAQQYLHMEAAQEQITVIPNGIDTSEFVDLPPRGAIRRKLGIPESHRIVLFLGRINRVKGADILVNALANLPKDVDVVIAGPDDGGLATVTKMTDDLGLRHRVWYLGIVTGREKLATYVDAELLVVPSRYEIFGLVTFESIMCGTPVVVSDACGIAPLVQEAGMGYVARAGDSLDLGKKIDCALSNPSECNSQVERGRRYVLNNLEWETVVSRLEAVYRESLSRNRMVRNRRSRYDPPVGA